MVRDNLSLDDVGTEVELDFLTLTGGVLVPARVFVKMGVKSPSGSMFIFGQTGEPEFFNLELEKRQCKAIGVFMEQHRNEC